MQILQSNPYNLPALLSKYGLMPYIDDVAVKVGGMTAFESQYLPVLERFADRVQEIPLQKIAFADLGGALVCGTRSAALAVRSCDACIFSPTETAAQRLTNDAHYRWLAFCATLGTVYAIAAASIDVVHTEGSSPVTYSWADDVALVDWRPSYQMAWVDRPQYVHSRLVPFLLPLFFPGQFAHLGRQLVSDFGAAINPTLVATAAEVPLARVVRQSIERIIADEKAGLATWVTLQAPESDPSASPNGVAGAPATNVAVTTSPAGATPPQPSASGNVDPATGEILTAEQGADAGISPLLQQKPPTETPQQVKAREWLMGITARPDLEAAIVVLQDGRVHLGRKAMGFGATPTTIYKLLFDAKVVAERREDGCVLNKDGSEIYKAAKAARSPS